MQGRNEGNCLLCTFDGAHEKTGGCALLKSDKSVTRFDESTGKKNRYRQAIRRLRLAREEFATFAGVEGVDNQADDEPTEEAQPRHHFESRHQHHAKENAEHGDDGSEGSAKGAMPPSW